MKRNVIAIIALLCLVKLTVHLVGNQNYGFQRDELLHVSVSDHLAAGYVEFPPLIAFTGRIATTLFGYSLEGIRLFSSLAGVAILILCCLMAKEMGGGKHSIFLSGVAVLSFLPFYRNHTLFQPVAFDQLFWTLGFYLILVFMNSKDNRYLIYLAFCVALGLLNKYTFVIWTISVFTAMVFYDRGYWLKNKYVYWSALIVLLLVLPNVIWQVQNDFPALVHHQRLKEVQLDRMDKLEFATVQLEFPFTLVLSLIGLVGLFINQEIKKYFNVGLAVVILFVLMWALQAKAYYFFGAYPVLFAAGAVIIEKFFRTKPVFNYGVAAALFLPIVYFIPRLTPVLPIEKFVTYADIKPNQEGRYILTGDYADMFGWQEQVALIDSVYQTLSKEQQQSTIVWAENYGEAGAIQVLGDRYGLPDPVSFHASFWTFGPPKHNYNTCISIGLEHESVSRVFEETLLIKRVKHPYCIDEENDIPVYLCRKPKVDFRQIWPELKKYVFG